MAVAAILSPMLLLPVSAQEVEEPGHSAGHGTPREDPVVHLILIAGAK
jgi:hypothetical protein